MQASFLTALDPWGWLQKVAGRATQQEHDGVKVLKEAGDLSAQMSKAASEAIGGNVVVKIKAPDNKNLLLHARAMREYFDSCFVDRLYWFDTEDMQWISEAELKPYSPKVLKSYITWAKKHKRMTNNVPEFAHVDE